MPSPQASRLERRSIERWVIDRVAFYLECPAEDVDPAVPLAETGMDSASSVGLCGDVEDRFGIEADPTLVFDHPTIAAITRFIAEQAESSDRAA